jgi:GAF domain-containing protein
MAVLEIVTQIDAAGHELPKLEQILESVGKEIKGVGFEFVAIQLVNKEEKTIETVYGQGLTPHWFTIAKHTIQGDPELWDIQADIVMHRPPRIEIIAGHDRRFDAYIFKKFGHDQQVRLFAPIILLPSEVTWESLRWDQLKEISANVDDPSDGDRRIVLQICKEDWARAEKFQSQVIGTIEAGFYDPSREICPSVAQRAAMIAGQRAWDIFRALLENVFWVIAKGTKRLVGADNVSLYFARDESKTDSESVHYVYEACEGRRFGTSITPNGLGQQSLKKRKTLVIPDKERGEDEQSLREVERAAYDAGIRALAVIPILVSEETDQLFAMSDEEALNVEKEGLLYVAFSEPHWFSPDEITSLELLRDRAIAEIRYAAHHGKTRDRARRLSNMNRIAQSLAANPTSNSMLAEIAGASLNVLAADVVSVYEYDEQKNRLVSDRPATAGRLIKPDLVTSRAFDSISAPAQLLRTGKNRYANDVLSDPILARQGTEGFERSFVARERVQSAAGVLLRGGTLALRGKPKDEILGLMFINFRSPHCFAAEDLRIIETLASTAAVAIGNQRRRGFRTAERWEKVVRTTVEAISREAPDEIARAIIERIDGSIDERVDRRLASRRFDNFDGTVTVSICNSEGNELTTKPIEDKDYLPGRGTYLSAPSQLCQVIVRLIAAERNSSGIFKKRLVIKDGNVAESVTFDVAPESNNIIFDPPRAATTLNANDGSSLLSFYFTTPHEDGKYDIMVEIGQRNRLVQVIPALVTVDSSA